MNKLTPFALAGIAILLSSGLNFSNEPQIDEHATAPGANIAASAPLGSFSYGKDLAPLDVPPGDHQVRVTLPDEPGVVVSCTGTLTPDGGLGLNMPTVGNAIPDFVALTPSFAAGFNG